MYFDEHRRATNKYRSSHYKGNENARYLLWFFILFPLWRPIWLSNISRGFDLFFDVSRVVSALIIMWLLTINMKKPNTLVLLTLFYALCIVASSFINKQSPVACLSQVAPMLCFILFADYMFSKDWRTGTKVILVGLEILVYANLASLMVFSIVDMTQNGYALLGHKNYQICYTLTAFCVATYRNDMLGNKSESLRAKSLAIAGILTSLITWSVTSVLVWTLIVVLLVFRSNRFLMRFINVFVAIAINSFFFIGVIIFNIQYKFSWLIVEILHKDMTFTGRTSIWATALSALKNNYLLGTGLLSNSGAGTVNMIWWNMQIHAHNQALQILLQGGGIALVLFVCLLVLATNKLRTSDRAVVVCKVVLFAVLICCLGDVYFVNSSPLYVIIPLAFHWEQIHSGENIKVRNFDGTSLSNIELKVRGVV